MKNMLNMKEMYKNDVKTMCKLVELDKRGKNVFIEAFEPYIDYVKTPSEYLEMLKVVSCILEAISPEDLKRALMIELDNIRDEDFKIPEDQEISEEDLIKLLELI